MSRGDAGTCSLTRNAGCNSVNACYNTSSAAAYKLALPLLLVGGKLIVGTCLKFMECTMVKQKVDNEYGIEKHFSSVIFLSLMMEVSIFPLPSVYISYSGSINIYNCVDNPI